MRISARDWENYISKLSRVNKKAAEEMQAFIDKNGMDDMDAVVEYAYALATKYGEASGELACEMYDAVAEASGVYVPPAEMAPTASYEDTAKAVRGTLLNPHNTVPQTVGRLVKQTGADTTLKNALRDGAKFAWIPHGETCAFCITLASRGWQNMSRNALRNGHAEHIHANCNCEYAISFDKNPSVEGYDPDYYLKIYKDADGVKPATKIKNIRRMLEEKPEMSVPQSVKKDVEIPPFTPAKSKQEAEEYARRFAERVDYSGLSLANANLVNEQLNVLTSKYPINRLGIVAHKAQKGVACANYERLQIDGKKLGKTLTGAAEQYKRIQASDLETLQDFLGRYKDAHRIPPGPQKFIDKLQAKLKFKRWGVHESYEDHIKCIVTHEYGHILSDQYFGMINKNLANGNYSKNWGLREQKKKWEEAFMKARQTGDIYKISEYANTNVDEFFAESFLAREMGEKLPDYIESLLVEVLQNGIM